MDKNNLLEKWLNNDLTASEQETFSQLEDYKLNQDILATASRFKAAHFSTVDDFNTFKKRYEAYQKPIQKLSWFYPVMRVACVLAILLCSYYFFMYNSDTVVNTYANQKTEVVLPDNSKIILNTVSKISYDASNWEDKRELNLEGEAFFKVAKGKQFDVVTSSGIISVVGTAFNVKQREDYFEVKCFEGIVNVTSDTINRQLTAGHVFQILNGNFTEETITYEAPYWTINLSTFKAIPFKEVVAELERQYDVEITLKDDSSQRLFTGRFVHDNLENALISITQPMSLTYKMSTSKQVVIHDIKK